MGSVPEQYDSVQSELEILRAKVKEYEQAEFARMKEEILDLRHERDHWKSEAQRQVEIARQIQSDANQVIGVLQGQLSTIRETHGRRNIRGDIG